MALNAYRYRFYGGDSGAEQAFLLQMYAAGYTAASVFSATDQVLTGTTVGRTRDYLNSSGTAIDVFPRTTTLASQALASGVLLMSFFTPPTNETATQITMVSGSSASSGVTLARMGLYTMDGTTATLVARTANDTTIMAAALTAYTRSFATAGGYPASYDLVAGNRYAVAYVAVGSGTTSVQCFSGPAAVVALSPRINGVSTGQTDLPTTITSFGSDTRMIYGRLS